MTTKKTLKKTGDRTLIIYAHPYDGSFNHAVLETATSALDKAGRSYDVVDLYADGFDPRMPAEELALFTEGGTLDPLVSHYQKLIEGASRIVVIAPIWWSELPAIIKGFVDKVMKQNWAYYPTATGVKGRLTHIQQVLVLNRPDLVPAPVLRQLRRLGVPGSRPQAAGHGRAELGQLRQGRQDRPTPAQEAPQARRPARGEVTHEPQCPHGAPSRPELGTRRVPNTGGDPGHHPFRASDAGGTGGARGAG